MKNLFKNSLFIKPLYKNDPDPKASYTSVDGRHGWHTPPTDEDVEKEKEAQDGANREFEKQIEEKEAGQAEDMISKWLR